MADSPRSHLRIVASSELHPKVRFEELFLHHLDSLYRTGLRLTRKKEDTEDLLQETLLKAMRGFHQLADHSKMRAWLFQILVNTFYNNEKSRKRDLPIVDVELNEDLVMSSLDVPQYDPLEVFGNFLSDEVARALDHLSTDFRIVLLLFDVEGLRYEEIAEICHCSKGTVASRLYRAREILRRSLEDYARIHGYGKKR